MIIFKEMGWSNCFSYGKGNVIKFTENPITQLVGLNGHGKSSIPLILELGLFNKNSKGTKTTDILNRYISENAYTIYVKFSKGTDEYLVDVKRASTQTVKFTRNGIDISSHTATNTFKVIEEVLGFDHKTFVQLIYQSSAQSLEFLTATDTNRKKFLIGLLNLEKYVQAFEVFKASAAEVQKEVGKIESAISVVSGWLDKNSKVDLTEKTLQEVPPAPTAQVEDRSKLVSDLLKIEETNKAITKNNQYKQILDSIQVEPVHGPIQDTSELVKAKTESEKTMRDASSFLLKVKSLKSHCPICSHPLDNSKELELVEGYKKTYADAEKDVKILTENILKIQADNKIIEDIVSKNARWEQYHALFNDTMESQILDKNNLEARVISLKSEIEKRQKEIQDAVKANETIAAHNSKVRVISEQLDEMNSELKKHKESLGTVTHKLNNLNILTKAFSTNGLIAFKIESMVKDLENLVNQYLAELSEGRFQLSFVINGEKLNVVITDNGTDIDMSSLSTGEKARVNTATLLAIRNLMQQLSNTKVNLLILDETMENLDNYGKSNLMDILLEDKYLNTFLISHSYSHPLLEKLHIVKENNISRIE